MTEGVPQYRQHYKGVKAEALDGTRVKFTLPEGDKALALGLASTILLPKSFWGSRKLSDPVTEIPSGSGAYTVKDYKIGQYVVYQRLPGYWAADLPVNKGLNNFDAIRYDYYRDDTVAFEAFKAGEFDFNVESIAKNWATMYTGKQFDSLSIVKEEIPDTTPQSMQAFVFNVKKPVFADRRVREALGYALDFEWLNKNYFYNQYVRNRSYFTNTDYEAKGLPGADELAVLNPVKAKLPAEVFTKEYKPPVTDGTGNIRAQLRAALDLMKQAGWEVNKDGKLANVKTGEPMAFELLYYSATTERVVIALQKNLEKMGVTMTLRMVDTTQFTKRLRSLDYDMIWGGYGAMFYPSLDVKEVWRSDYIDSSYNTAGVQDPTIDYFVDGIVANQANEKTLLAWGRAFDRVLTWNYYVIPMWHTGSYRIAYWNKFSRPAKMPRYDLGVTTWWVDKAKEAKLPKR
jgi:microcin C transport system substrate-binding protein